VLSAVLLEAWSTWTIVAITSLCLAGLSQYSEPLILPPSHRFSHGSLYVQGMLICFLLNAALLVIFITRISHNVRTRDAQLADLRQRAAEEEHIVRMGLLASGAAHELGTPLATMSVILCDWLRMPEISKNAVLQEEIEEMQAQLLRCKTIVSGILLSAGEARGESSIKTTLNTFLDDVARKWRATRPVASFVYQNRIGQDVPVAFDSTLRQMLYNLLDNAFEASSQWLSMVTMLENDWVTVVITDAGPGFSPSMLTHFGKPYQSTKGRPGGGLGLFLAVNVARTLGGTLTARNRPEGGAVVQISLPLAAIALDAQERQDVI
jgi:two-component system sensor histidine kinase RegB